jgi:large subunit ribosomal protein L30
MSKFRIKWVKSDIGFSADQKRTIKALGLHRLNDTVEQKDSPSVRGMIRKVSHLVKVEVIDNAAA